MSCQWPTGCGGEPIPSVDLCFVHASPANQEAALARWVEGTPLVLDGARVDAAVLRQIRSAAKTEDEDEHQRAVFAPISFERTVFEGVHFKEIAFSEWVSFRSAVFRTWTYFQGCDFREKAYFFQTRFEAGATFGNCRFKSDAKYMATHFGPLAHFVETTADSFDFTGAIFEGLAMLQLRAQLLDFDRACFSSGGEIAASGGSEILLDRVTFGGPLVLTAARHQEGEETVRPRLLSLRWSDVGKLVASEVDLRACRFVKAHNLNRMRLEGGVEFARTPPGRLWRGRRALAEEHQVRADRGGAGWYPAACRPPDWYARKDPVLGTPLAPQYVAAIYRDLRRGLEDAGDEPGAADFYYGEMEMRRLDRQRPLVERGLLWIYWLVAGYGLRATRALAALLVTIIAFALLLWWFGFDPRTHFTRALLFSAESTSSLFRTPALPQPTRLTEWGEAMQIPLRLLGPLFLGLALLSLRGRVKR